MLIAENARRDSKLPNSYFLKSMLTTRIFHLDRAEDLTRAMLPWLFLQLWQLYTRAMIDLGGGSVLGVALQPLATNVLAGLVVRSSMTRPGAPVAMSAWRAAMAQVVLAWGASLILAVVAGVRPPWLADASALRAAAFAHWLMFHCPGDAAFRALRAGGPLAWTLPALRSATLAISVGRQGVDLIAGAWIAAGAPPAHALSLVVVGALSGCGGQILAELTGVLLLPRADYTRPRGAVPPAVVTAAVASAVYVFLLRDPAHHGYVARAAAAIGSAADTLLPAAVGGGGVGIAIATSVDAAWPLPQAQAVAVLAACLASLAYCLTPDALSSAVTAAIDALPGGRSVIRRADLGPDTYSDIFGQAAPALAAASAAAAESAADEGVPPPRGMSRSRSRSARPAGARRRGGRAA